MLVRLGACIRTSYGTGPYIVAKIDGPCTCPEYVQSVDGNNRPSKEHYHLTVKGPNDKREGWPPGFTLDGRSVRNGDRLIDASQGELF